MNTNSDITEMVETATASAEPLLRNLLDGEVALIGGGETSMGYGG